MKHPTRLASRRRIVLAAAALPWVGTQAAPAASPVPASSVPACSARSSAMPLRIVELYTSEGCSSCPPADAWLSTLKGRSDVIALGFHVHYWDRLGWPDRFASEAWTRRQYDAAARSGSRSVYTPQVLLDGRDWRGWHALRGSARLPAARADAAGHALPEIVLARAGAAAGGPVQARVAPQPGAAHDWAGYWAGYWAVTEDGHESRVRAGENAGETLRHDHVVRLLQPLAPFAAREGLSSRLDVPPGVPAHPRRVVFVLTTVAQALPVQAVALDC